MNYFIWTECMGCPEIGNIAVKSFLKNHKGYFLNVFTYEEDKKYLPVNSQIIYHTFKKTSNLTYILNRFLNKLKLITVYH